MNTLRPVAPARRPGFPGIRPLALEQRFMFDGTAVAEATQAAVTEVAHAAGDASPADGATPVAVETRAVDPGRNEGRKEAVFIDTTLADWQSLADGVREGMAVVTFDGNRDGLAQIAAWAAGKEGYDAFHILSHGSEGRVNLGAAHLSEASLASAAVRAQLAGIGRALTADGDLLLYGCDVAANEAGQRLIVALAEITGADVAASTDATGAAALGGDWTLERASGDIETSLFAVPALLNFDGLLETVTLIAGDTPGDMASPFTKEIGGQDFTFTPASNCYVDLLEMGGFQGLYAWNADTDSETQITISAPSGYTFDLSSMRYISDRVSVTLTLTLTFSDGSTNSEIYTLTGDETVRTLNASITTPNDIIAAKLVTSELVYWNDFIITDVKPLAPAITSASYDALTNVLTVTGSGMTAGDVIDVSKLALTGEGGASYTLTSANVTAASATSFSIALNTADQLHVEGLLNKNGSASVGGTTFNLAADTGWNATWLSPVSQPTPADLAGNAVTVTNVQTPTITSATYNAATGTLVVTGADLVKLPGANNDIDASKLTLTGEGGETYTLTGTPDVEITSATGFTLTLSTADRAAVNLILNKNGTLSTGSTTYNLAAADDWNTTIGDTNIADAAGNGIAVSNVPAPVITGASYDAATGTLTVTGSGFVRKAGGSNDVDASRFTLTGAGGNAYTLTDTPDVEISSGTSFVLTLSEADRLHVNGLLNRNGGVAGDSTAYVLAAADDWLGGTDAAPNIAQPGKGITVSNVQTPTVTSAIYDSETGVLTVTGTGLFRKSGATNDIDVTRLTLTGEGGATYTLTADTANVEITSATSFTITLGSSDRAAVEALLDQFGGSSSGGTPYNLAADDDWLTAADAAMNIADASNGVTVAINPKITSATYDAATGALVVMGTNFQPNGGGMDIDASKFTLTGEGGETYTLTDTADVEADSPAQFTLVLSATDRAAVNQMLNKAGDTSTGGTSYNLAAADDWNTAVTGGDIADLFANGVTVSNVAAPAITGATYDSATGVLTVTGTGFLKLVGGGNDIDVSKLSIDGEGGESRALTSASVDIVNGTSFSITLNAADRAALALILNRNGATATGGAAYNLAAAEDWAAGADPATVVADLAGNGVTVANVVVPAITGATYDAATGVLTVTGTGFLKLAGAGNDIDVSKLRIDGEGGASVTLTSGSVDITSATGFTVTLNAADRAAVNQILNRNGAMATGGAAYNLAALEDWAAGADTGVAVADVTGNPVTVGGVAVPTITGATYDYASHTLVVTGTGFLKLAGAGNDIDISKLRIEGAGGASYTLSSSSAVDIDSATQFTVVLNGADIHNVAALLHKDGASADDGTTYNLAALENWAAGADAAVVVADPTGNGIAVSNYTPPIITSATYNASNGRLDVTGSHFVALAGGVNDVDVSKLSFVGEGGISYTLTDATGVEIISGTQFTLFLSVADRLNVNGLLNKNGASATDGTSYNLAAASGWMAGSPAAVDTGDLAGNAVTVSNVQTPGLDSAYYDANTGVLTVSGTHLFGKPGANNDIDPAKLTFTGLGGGIHTLGDTSGVEIHFDGSTYSFSLTLGSADRAAVNALLDQPWSDRASDNTVYNLAAAEGWLAGAGSALIADAATGIQTIANPRITSAAYDAATGALVVTGQNFSADAGADIIAAKFTLAGEGGATWTLTDTPNVEIDSATQFTLTLSAADKAALDLMLNRNGATSTGGAAYGLSAADDWGKNVGDISETGKPVTVANVAVPTITGATYDAATGVLTVTGARFLRLGGADNDIDVSKLSISGAGGASHTLTSAGVDVASATSFTVTLNAADRAALDLILNKNGSASIGGTTYNLAAGEDWAAGAHASVIVADMTGNGIVVSNFIPIPEVTGVTSATADGIYKIGDTISIQVNFNENVTVTGTPTLALASGGTATYAGGSGTSTLSFTYVVGAGHASADLDFASTAALSLAGGTVKGVTGKDAVLILPDPGDAGSLGANKDLMVDGIAPAVSGNLSVPANGTYGASQTLDFTVTFDDTMTVSGTGSTLTLDIGGATRQATYVSKTATSITYRYTVQVGDSDANGIAVTGIALNGDTIRDTAGNNANLSLSGHLPGLAGVLVDAVLPELSGTVTVGDGSYKAGDVLSFTVPLNKAVTVNTGGGFPTLDLTIGATPRSAAYDASASTATALVFKYTVQAGDTDGNGIAIDALSLNGAVIQDNHGNNLDAMLAGHLPSLAGVLVDTTAPSVASVAVPGDGTYKVGDTLSFTVNYDEAVTVDTAGGTPRIALTLDTGGTVYADYVSGSGTTALTFTYTVPAGNHADDNGITIGALSANGGTLRDTAGNDAVLTLNGVGATGNVWVDGRAPVVTSVSAPADATYAQGQTLSFTVNFDMAVTVAGTPRLALTLDTGGAVYADYVSGSGTTALLFTYTVTAGDQDHDGVAIGVLSLNGGTLRSVVGNDAVLTLDNVGSTTGVLVDAALPEISGTVTVADGSYKAGDVLSFSVPLNKAVTVNTGGGFPTLDLAIGATARSAAYDAAASTATALVFKYTVQAGDTDSNGIAIAALSLNGAVIQDSHGNNLDATLAGHLPSLAGVLVDTTAPSIASVSVPADGTYKAGDTLSFTVNYDEAVTVDTAGGTPRIALTLDTGGTVYAHYVSGSGTTALTFAYTVPAGNHADDDGITVGALSANGGALRDAAGNNANLTLNGVGATGGVLVDATAPAFVAATVNGATLTLTYDKVLDAVNPPAAGDFAVTVAGKPVAVTGVSVNGPAGTVALTLATSVTTGQAVTVAYADPGVGDDTKAIQDIVGQDAASLATTTATNLTPTLPPPPPPPPAPEMPTPPAAVTPQAPFVLEPATPPPAAVAFFSPPTNGMLSGLAALLGDTAQPTPLAFLPIERASGETAATVTLTRPADVGGFRIIVVPPASGMSDALLVNRPMNDFVLPASGSLEIIVPVDVFAHTDANAMVTISVAQADGRPLPPWMSFDPRTGKLEGDPPAGFQGKLVLRVVARDSQGREAVTTFNVLIGRDNTQERPAQPGRSSLGEQIRRAGLPQGLSAHLTALADSAEAARMRI